MDEPKTTAANLLTKRAMREGKGQTVAKENSLKRLYAPPLLRWIHGSNLIWALMSTVYDETEESPNNLGQAEP